MNHPTCLAASCIWHSARADTLVPVMKGLLLGRWTCTAERWQYITVRLACTGAGFGDADFRHPGSKGVRCPLQHLQRRYAGAAPPLSRFRLLLSSTYSPPYCTFELVMSTKGKTRMVWRCGRLSADGPLSPETQNLKLSTNMKRCSLGRCCLSSLVDFN